MQLLLTNTNGQRIRQVFGRRRLPRSSLKFMEDAGRQNISRHGRTKCCDYNSDHTIGPAVMDHLHLDGKSPTRLFRLGAPNGGAAVKHLTIKQLNCGAAVSLSGKLIQRAVRMIPFIRNLKKKKAKRSVGVFTFQAKVTLCPRRGRSSRPGKSDKVLAECREP